MLSCCSKCVPRPTTRREIVLQFRPLSRTLVFLCVRLHRYLLEYITLKRINSPRGPCTELSVSNCLILWNYWPHINHLTGKITRPTSSRQRSRWRPVFIRCVCAKLSWCLLGCELRRSFLIRWKRYKCCCTRTFWRVDATPGMRVCVCVCSFI